MGLLEGNLKRKITFFPHAIFTISSIHCGQFYRFTLKALQFFFSFYKSPLLDNETARKKKCFLTSNLKGGRWGNLFTLSILEQSHTTKKLQITLKENSQNTTFYLLRYKFGVLKFASLYISIYSCSYLGGGLFFQSKVHLSKSICRPIKILVNMPRLGRNS